MSSALGAMQDADDDERAESRVGDSAQNVFQSVTYTGPLVASDWTFSDANHSMTPDIGNGAMMTHPVDGLPVPADAIGLNKQAIAPPLTRESFVCMEDTRRWAFYSWAESGGVGGYRDNVDVDVETVDVFASNEHPLPSGAQRLVFVDVPLEWTIALDDVRRLRLSENSSYDLRTIADGAYAVHLPAGAKLHALVKGNLRSAARGAVAHTPLEAWAFVRPIRPRCQHYLRVVHDEDGGSAVRRLCGYFRSVAGSPLLLSDQAIRACEARHPRDFVSEHEVIRKKEQKRLQDSEARASVEEANGRQTSLEDEDDESDERPKAGGIFGPR